MIRARIIELLKKDNFQSLLSNMITALIGIVSFSLLARKLNTEDFSNYIIFVTGASLIEMLRFGITSNATICFLPGTKQKKREQIIGSFVKINLLTSFALSFFIFLIKSFFYDYIRNSSFELFFNWYPYILIASIPFNNALTIFQADIKFNKILFIRILNNFLFFLVILIGTLYWGITLNELILYFLYIQIFLSGLCIVLKWDYLISFKNSNNKEINKILNFGKFSVFTLLSSNLLRNADVFIIGLGALGSNAVAIYSIPLKLTEIMQVPLRSFAATAFPKISKAYTQGNLKKVKYIFNTYTGAISIFFIFIAIFILIFDRELIILISGHSYLNNGSEHLNILIITQILTIYCLILPLDKMTGITLDSLNKPQINSFKVLIMLLTNLLGDIIAVFIFKSLELVAITSILFTLLGSYLGIYYLNKELQLSIKDILLYGLKFYSNISKRTYLIIKK